MRRWRRWSALALVGAALTAAPALAAQDAVEIIEIRLHGNYELPDAEVLELAGIAVGDRLADADLAAVEERLRASGRFARVRVERRYRSLSDRDRVVLLITVHEKVGVASKFLFLPELDYNEDEGFSLGARVSAKDLFGGDELISMPVSVFGVDRAALEVSRAWDSGYRLGGFFQWRQFENPFYEVDDERTGGGLWAEKRFGQVVSLRLHGDYHDVEFGGVGDELWRYGARLELDTRPTRIFPYDSVLLRAGWERVEPDSQAAVNRYRFEVRGYQTLVGQLVVAGRGLLWTADAPLPAYERAYVGGMVSLRGWAAGTFSGDSTAQGTVELRLPITSVLTGSFARFGVTAFWDTAATWDHGESLGDQRFVHGVGAGVFLLVPFVNVNVDVANNLEGDTRVHVGLGFRF